MVVAVVEGSGQLRSSLALPRTDHALEHLEHLPTPPQASGAHVCIGLNQGFCSGVIAS